MEGDPDLVPGPQNFVKVVSLLGAIATDGSQSSSISARALAPFAVLRGAGASSPAASFYDGTTLLGTGTISAGKASITTSALGVGTHSITSVYGGDSNYSGATSAVLSQVVVSVADFTVASSTGRQLIPPGASASYNIVVS